MKYIKFYVLLFLSVAMSCSTDDDSIKYSNIEFNIIDKAEVKTRTAPMLSSEYAQDFLLNIREKNANKAIFLGSLAQFNALREFKIAKGNYSVIATYGENNDVSLDSPFYSSEEIYFSIDIAENKTINIPCGVANSFLSFSFKNKSYLDKVLSQYVVEARVGDKIISVDPQSDSNIYVKAGTEVSIYLKGRWIENNLEYRRLFATINNVKPSRNYKYTLTIDESKNSGTLFDIHVDDESEVVNISDRLPKSWLPKPQISTSGFDQSNTISLTETVGGANTRISYSTSAPLDDAMITIDCEDEVISKLNRTYVLSEMSDFEKQSLEKHNIIFPTKNTSSGELDLSVFANNLLALDNKIAINKIKLKIKANDRWSDECVCSFNIDKPRFDLTFFASKLWSKEFEVEPMKEENVELGDFRTISSDLKYYYSTDRNSWTMFSDSTKTTGLTSGTRYYIKPMYRGKISGRISEVKTYEALTIPNQDFNMGYDTSYPKSQNPLYMFRGGWIDTRNSLTCNKSGANVFYVSKSSTLPLRAENSNIAHLMTIGWGSGNTCSFGNKLGSVIKNISAGMLCVGKYNPNDDEIESKEAYVRPTSLSFNYKAKPHSDDEYIISVFIENITNGNVTVLGKGEYKSNETINQYTTKKINIDYLYDQENKNMPITHIRIIFKSGTKEDRDHLNDRFEDTNVGWFYSSAYIKGSELWIKSFNLDYDK